jgi:hypothetical protein
MHVRDGGHNSVPVKRLLLFALCGGLSAQSSLILLGAGGPSAVVAKAFVAGGNATGYTSGGLMIPNITLDVGTASNRSLFVAVFTEPGCGNCNSSATFAGTQPMAQITYYAAPSQNATLWYLASPTSGSHDVSYAFSVGYENVHAVAWSYSGASQSIPTNFVTGTATQMSPFTESLTISGSTSWLAGTWFSGSSTLFGGTGTTVRTGIANYVGVDSGATVSPGSQSLQVTNLSGLSETEIWILWELQ